MTPVNIVFRNGLPTQKCIEEISKAFFGEQWYWKISPANDYGKVNGNNKLRWSDKYIQEKMDGFIEYLVDLGMTLGKYQPYENKYSLVGHLEIMPQSNFTVPVKTERKKWIKLTERQIYVLKQMDSKYIKLVYLPTSRVRNS